MGNEKLMKDALAAIQTLKVENERLRGELEKNRGKEPAALGEAIKKSLANPTSAPYHGRFAPGAAEVAKAQNEAAEQRRATDREMLQRARGLRP